MCCFFFFFQAEDGIRDAQESRGLGDVYKRQGRAIRSAAGGIGVAGSMLYGAKVFQTSGVGVFVNAGVAVSYTHLTLPTIYSV